MGERVEVRRSRGWRMPSEAIGPALATLLTVVCGVMALASYDGLGSLATIGVGLVVVLLVLGALGARAGSAMSAASRGRLVTLHIDGGHGPKVAARHEVGHKLATEAVGGKVRSVQIYPDGSGFTDLWLPDDIDPVDRLAVDFAGAKASGTESGCGGRWQPWKGSDFWYAEQLLKSFPRGERTALRRAGEKRAAELTQGWLGGPNAQVLRLSKKLQAKWQM